MLIKLKEDMDFKEKYYSPSRTDSDIWKAMISILSISQIWTRLSKVILWTKTNRMKRKMSSMRFRSWRWFLWFRKGSRYQAISKVIWIIRSSRGKSIYWRWSRRV